MQALVVTDVMVYVCLGNQVKLVSYFSRNLAEALIHVRVHWEPICSIRTDGRKAKSNRNFTNASKKFLSILGVMLKPVFEVQ
jgi:hypothetical protein